MTRKSTQETKDNRSIDFKNDMRFKTVIERIKLCFSIAVICFVLAILHIGCPIKFTTGISCPGCGMTRAVLSVLQLDFKAAIYYHPLFLLTPFMLALFLFEYYIPVKVYKIAWIIIIMLFLITYIIRLLFTPNNVVNVDINNGIMLKLIHQIYVGGLK